MPRFVRSQIVCFAGLLAATLLLSLNGCATTTTTSTASTGSTQTTVPEVATSSDVSEVRKRARLRLELASGYLERGQASTALDEIKQALVLYPEYVDALTMRGLVYMQLSQAELAEDSFRRAVALDSGNGDALHNFAWFLCRSSRLEESFARFRQAIAVPGYPGVVASHLAYGVCLIRGNQLTAAQTSLYRAFELDPGNPATATNLAMVHFRQGDFERARFYARKVNNTELANPESLWLGIRIERKLASEQNLEQLASQLRRRYPESRESRLLERGAFDEQ
jgi:type IV pilus assembly protein PilF